MTSDRGRSPPAVRGEPPPSAVPWTAIGCASLLLVVASAIAFAVHYVATIDWPPVGIN